MHTIISDPCLHAHIEGIPGNKDTWVSQEYADEYFLEQTQQAGSHVSSSKILIWGVYSFSIIMLYSSMSLHTIEEENSVCGGAAGAGSYFKVEGPKSEMRRKEIKPYNEQDFIEKERWNRNNQDLKMFANLGAGAGAGVRIAAGTTAGTAAGLGIGALVGSVIPVAGTAIGALVGGLIGGGIGLIAGGAGGAGTGAAVGIGLVNKKVAKQEQKQERQLQKQEQQLQEQERQLQEQERQLQEQKRSKSKSKSRTYTNK